MKAYISIMEKDIQSSEIATKRYHFQRSVKLICIICPSIALQGEFLLIIFSHSSFKLSQLFF